MKTIVILFAILGILIAEDFDSSKLKNRDFHIYTVGNKDSNISPKMIEDALKVNGFHIGQNADIQAELLHIYKDNNFKIYNNISFYHKEIMLDLINKQANAGILLPMGMIIYQSIGEDNLHIVLTTADLQAKVIGVNLQELENLEDAVLKVITTLFPSAIHTYSDRSKTQERELLTKYTLNLKDADFEDVREKLEEKFEEKFAKAGFAMPSYFDFTEDLGKNSLYDFYVTYAICKIDVLRIVIKVEPQAAVLGPCTTMIYKKKNENKIVMGFASMYNWISSANIEDKAARHELLETQRIYENILKDVTKN
jgi:uncharacterized protein (DUF302 family)